ncbi:MAG: dUTP diphosphatase [bacterium]
MRLNIKKLHPDAIIPCFAHTDDAGMDLFALKETLLQPGEKKNISTGIAAEIPDGYVGLIWDKGGMANQCLHTIAGVIDAGYRGDITILIINLSNKEVIIKKGQKFAQMLIQKIERPEIAEVSELSSTARHDGKFGSTGKF